MKNAYYVTQAGKQCGPFTLEEIGEQVASQKLALLDYIYDEQALEWRLIMEFPDLQRHLLSKGMSALQPKTPATSEDSSNQESEDGWYILQGSSQLGPYPISDLVRMLQTKRLFEYDLVCKAGFPEWKRLGDCAEFSPENIKDLFKNEKTLKGDVANRTELMFFRRRHARSDYNSSVIIHNNKQVWKGTSVEISQGGAGVVLHSDQLDIGQNVFLHFKPGDHIPPFNAISLLVSRRAMPDKSFKYGLKFTNINQSIQLAIKNFAETSPGKELIQKSA